MTNKSEAETGHLLIIAGPQGVGKSYTANRLCALRAKTTLARGVVTQRIPDDDNDTQVHRETFGRLLGNGELCMVMELWHHYYGYLKRPIDAYLSDGWDVVMMLLFPHDVRQAKRLFSPSTTIYLRPVGWDFVEERLTSRGFSDTQDFSDLMIHNRGLVKELDLLNWDIVVDVFSETDQLGEITKHLPLLAR